ncbi:MAG: putative amino acid permease [Pseudonocardiales bacterium]|nr:putative amino acid permease [Pseudonocardiales bacterium]
MAIREDIFAVRNATTMSGEDDTGGLKRSISALGLTAMGVGAIIGTGIYVVIGEGAAEAGPAVILAFVLAAVTCMFSALSYAELASSVPVSGSAYSYSYATMGELVAFIIGWDLILEYGVSCAAIAVGWGGNFNAFLESAFETHIPDHFAKSPGSGGWVNLPAVFIVLAVTLLLIRGTKESAKVNLVMVGVKIAILVFFIVVALTSFHTSNFHNFAPKGSGSVVTAAGIIFFAYIGFDAVSTASEESEKPERDLPIAVIGSLIVSTVLYILVAVAAIGVAPLNVLTNKKSDAPLIDAFNAGIGWRWGTAILAVGAVIAITSVLLVIMYGQTRIFFSMARDGLLPQRMAQVNQRFGTPAGLTLVLGSLIAVLAALVPLSAIVKLVNIGTLFAFMLVNIGVVILRRTRPDMERPFRVPFSPVFPIIGLCLCLYLMHDLPLETWYRFLIWLVVGLIVYFGYSRKNSKLRTRSAGAPPDQSGRPIARVPRGYGRR